jgi:3-oxoacyl-(acyl-carrier-protein) synthase
VIIGRGTYVNRGNAAALQQGVMVESILRILKQLHPEHTDAELAEIKRQIKAGLPPFHSDTASGLVPNIITGRIANRLDLMGPNYLIDAACASSLVAVEMAARELRTGNCDLALAGGVNSNTSPVLMMIFSQLGALSHRGQLSSFDKDADGTLLGEGVGMVVLKRLAEAERDGNHIYAVLKNIGIASDGRATHVLAPRRRRGRTALRRAYEPVGIDPLTVGLVEAHGTGTPVGDVVEVEALRRVFPPRQTESPRCALGSVKSMISHTVPAAGVAGLIKAALALHHKVLPPTMCENPNPKLQLENTNFYINTETRPWIHGSSKTPRRAGVNAFGFGGINAHAILEEYTGPNQAPWMQRDWDSELFVFSGAAAHGGGGRCAAGAATSAREAAMPAFVEGPGLDSQLQPPYGSRAHGRGGPVAHRPGSQARTRHQASGRSEDAQYQGNRRHLPLSKNPWGCHGKLAFLIPRRRVAVPQHAGRSVHPLPGSAAACST